VVPRYSAPYPPSGERTFEREEGGSTMRLVRRIALVLGSAAALLVAGGAHFKIN
jgi:hypothetical protein